MSAPPFMQLYVSDYLGATRALTAEQHGAYLLLLMSMWNAEGDLPNDPKTLARLACCTASRWAKICGPVLEKFDVEGDRLTHARLRLELKKAQEKSIKRAEAGTRGGNAKALKHKEPAVAIATGLPCHSSEPEPEKKLGAKAPRRTSPDKPVVWSPQFEEAYAHYPDEMKRSKSRAACWPIWKDAAAKAGGEGALVGAVRRYRAEDKQHKGESKAPAFDRWLRDGRWEHWLEVRVTTAEARWTGPPEIRARVAMEQTEAFARSYLDHCEWTPDGIRPANGYAFDKLRHLRSLKDVKLLQPQERAA